MEGITLEFQNNNLLKILFIISLIFIIFDIILIAISVPSIGYEISIYNAYPWYFWLFFIVANFFAIMILAVEIFNENSTNRWVLGFFGILLGNFIILLLPFFRGYCFYGGAGSDLFTHIGYIKEISNFGHVSNTNFYPILHIFTKIITDLLDVPITETIKFIPILFSILYPLFMFLLAKSISKSKSQTLLITSLSLPLLLSFYHISIIPAYFSFVFVPLLLYVYHKRNSSKRKIEISILILTICFFIIFFHPITTLFSIILFSIFVIFNFFIKKSKNILNNDIINPKSNEITILLILTVTFFAWYTSFMGGIKNIELIINNLIYGSDLTILNQYISTYTVSNLTYIQTIELIIVKYGGIVLYTLLALVCCFIIINNLIFKKQAINFEFSYAIQLVFIFFVTILMLIINFIEADPFRVFRFFIMIASIFSGLVIGSLLSQTKKVRESNSIINFKRNDIHYKKILKIKIKSKHILLSIFFLIFFTLVLSIFNLYPSPTSGEANRQFTYMDFVGSSWFVNKRNINIQTFGDVGFNLMRMEHYINGVSNGGTRVKKEFSTPTHFGYLINETVFQTFNYTTSYLITTQNGRQAVYAFPENVQKSVRQWTYEDFIKLNNDHTAEKIYCNKEFQCWLIHE